MRMVKRALCVGAIAAVSALGAVGTAAAAPAPASEAAPAMAQWVLWAQHITPAECQSEGNYVLTHVSGVFNYDCDVTDAGAHDAPLVALWVYS